MKRAWIVAVVLVFVSAAGFAQTPSTPPLSGEGLAAILGPPAGSAACAALPEGVQPAGTPSAPDLKSGCIATAQCPMSEVGCSGNVCSSQDSDCANSIRGKVTCDGVTKWCPDCSLCAQCDATGSCMHCCLCQGFSFTVCNLSC